MCAEVEDMDVLRLVIETQHTDNASTVRPLNITEQATSLPRGGVAVALGGGGFGVLELCGPETDDRRPQTSETLTKHSW